MINSVENNKLKPDWRHEAYRKWREYVTICKTSKDPVMHQMRKVFNEVKNGATVVDIGVVIKNGGLNNQSMPKIAIARYDTQTVHGRYHENGTVSYNGCGELIELKQLLPTFGESRYGWCRKGEAPLPLIPPAALKKMENWKKKTDFYVLWEVEQWAKVVPEDPYLLRRLTTNMFVVEHQWDVTPIERAVMAGKMY